MPHLILNISPELAQYDYAPFFAEAHTFLSQYAAIEKCKSRVNTVSHVYLGQGEPEKVLLYLEVLLRPRSEEILNKIGEHLLAALKIWAESILKKTGFQADPTLEIRILNYYW